MNYKNDDFYFIIPFSIFNIIPGDEKISFTGLHKLLLAGKYDYLFISQCNVFILQGKTINYNESTKYLLR